MYIYLIESYEVGSKKYKIGYSKHPNIRIKQHDTGNPNQLTILYTFKSKHNRKVESALQNLYSHKCIKNEWFVLDYLEVSGFIDLCNKIERNLDFIVENRIN